MDTIKLIYFSGCPNYVAVKKLLLNLGCDFEEINQSKLPEKHPLKCYTSPAILKNGELIIGEKMDSIAGGCTIQLPSEEDFARSLKR
ncbi:MAG: hypothetical protein H8E42_01780 [Nitrospinae bacterium]|nr:hypothetical protein [Nitrospinota bacterium]MBL7019421.1 hypothetical protein [Nitrospinaceae bacterium]